MTTYRIYESDQFVFELEAPSADAAIVAAETIPGRHDVRRAINPLRTDDYAFSAAGEARVLRTLQLAALERPGVLAGLTEAEVKEHADEWIKTGQIGGTV